MIKRLLILPGFSPTNKDWADETARELGKIQVTEVYEWKHWSTGTPDQDWMKKATADIVARRNEPVNIVAKSIGTVVTMLLLGEKPDLVGKIILCGIPLEDLRPEDKSYYQILKGMPRKKVMVLQNLADNHGSFAEVRDFVKSINPEMPIIEKPGADHNYPYFEDFKDFFRNNESD